MIYAEFFFGIFVGSCVMAALLLILGANRPPSTTMHARRPPHPMPKYDDRMRSLSVPVPVTDWDVAIAAERPELGRVEYQFLGVTGEEEA